MSIGLKHAPMRRSVPTRHLPVYRSGAFRVVEGVNEGDPLADATDLVFEDVYELDPSAVPARLSLVAGSEDGPFLVGRDSAAGRPGARVYLDSLLTFMGPTNGACDVLVFVEVDADGTIAEVYLSALTPLRPAMCYALITIDRNGAPARFAGAARTAFARGPWSAAAAQGVGLFDDGRRAAAGY